MWEAAWWLRSYADCVGMDRQATQEPCQDCTRDGQEGDGIEGQEEIEDVGCVVFGAGFEEDSLACLCVPTSRSHILRSMGIQDLPAAY